MSARIDGSSIISIDSYRPNARPAAGASVPPVAAARATDTVRLSDDAVGLSALDKTLSSIPQVDHGRVAAIKAAVTEGRYVIDPEAIATRLSHFDWQLEN
ncbi:MAG: flagellar biosynthesis anti-sigma factor FlgM [Pseudomonadota bacterium]